MFDLDNRTPFVAQLAPGWDASGGDVALIAVKATYTLEASPRLAPEQLPLNDAYTYVGEEGASSLTGVPELTLPSGGTDVALLGDAWAPDGKPVDELDVSLQVGATTYAVRVSGDRYWRSYTLGRASRPEPFVRMPLIYERAYGGTAFDARGQALACAENPVGCGFRGARTRRAMRGTKLPNLALADGRPEAVAGFGWVAPHWAPRAAFAGTYDAAWQARQAPFLPNDFDSRHLRAGPAALYVPEGLADGAPVRLRNLGPLPELALRLAVPQLALRIRGLGDVRGVLRLEAVALMTSLSKFTVLWRAAIACPHEHAANARFVVALA